MAFHSLVALRHISHYPEHSVKIISKPALSSMPNHAIEGNNAHEDDVKLGSNRSFGVVFASVFAILGSLPLLHGEIRFHLWALILSILFLAITLAKPDILQPLNILWFRFGLLLAKIVNPIVMGLLFFCVVTPMAIMLRCLGKDPMKRKLDKTTTSYWQLRTPAGPEKNSMPRQF